MKNKNFFELFAMNSIKIVPQMKTWLATVLFFLTKLDQLRWLSTFWKMLEQSIKSLSDYYYLLLLSFTMIWASPVAQMIKNLPAMWETCVRSLGQEDPLEEWMATHSSILAQKIPWTEKPDGLQSVGLQSQTQLSD